MRLLRIVAFAVLSLAAASVRAQSADSTQQAATPASVAAATALTEAMRQAGKKAETDTSFYIRFNGELELRGNALSDIALRPMPFEPTTGALGQNYFAESWLRLRLDTGFRNAVRLVVQADLFDGVLFGDRAVGIAPARWRRDQNVGVGDDVGCDREASCQRQSIGFDPRYLFLEWRSSQSLVRIGQQAFTWGMGIVANDGDTRPFFGDYHHGDIVDRILFALKPIGMRHPLTLSVAADMVFDDGLASFIAGDRAYQGVFAAQWKEEHWELGLLGAYRSQENNLEDELEVGMVDLHARGDLTDPSGGQLYANFEGAIFFGSTSFARSLDREKDRVLQGLFAIDLGRKSRTFDVMLEAGWSSGDSNANDGVQSRATMDPDHRIGLILFPEVLAWQSARAVAYGSSSRLLGRAPRGIDGLVNDGGVSGATYLFPRMSWRPLEWLDIRLGAVLARTTTANVDPVEQGLSSRRVNYRGGDASARDLGLELDAAILMQTNISDTARIVGGLEGGVLFSGGALSDATGQTMGTLGMARLRAGLRW